MDPVFSVLNSKRGDVTEDKIEILKCDLNLVRIKWHEMNLSYVPKCHLLYEHVPDIFLQMNGLYDMVEDAIERWHQICMRYHTRIKSLRSLHKKQQNQTKHEHATINAEFNNFIEDVKEKRKRKRTHNNRNIEETNYNRKK